MIFDETKIGGMTLKNRIVRAAVGDHDADGAGHFGPKDLACYEALAKGGVGTVITGYSWVSDYPMGGRARQLGAYSDELIPGYRRLTDMVHGYGCNILQQLCHIGGASALPDVDRMGPSPGPGPYNRLPCREMTLDDIRRTEQAFAHAAVRAQRAGFDGVEIHGAHLFLISQFLSPAYNRRTDEYGGSDENRARFAAEVCRKVRAAVGPSYPVLFKVNCDDGVENGITRSGLLTACRMLEEAGASALSVSGAWRKYNQDTPYFLDATLAVAERAGIPVCLVGGVRGQAAIEQILRDTPVQYVAIARPFMAKPDLMEEWRDDQ